eukprot:TRINITY_DN3571_c0_g1_i1.p2 TRINITY_DN3571_c0_g1~~TRINITY_DN3571_c0_g1_i1.p2  ORF type:complete len:118 (+),score=23.13 TRINITY_DN3571_c0_g1_i1:62-415(+)
MCIRDSNNTVTKRGSDILRYTKTSSIISACYSIRDHLKYWFYGLPEDQIISMGVLSNGCYGVPNNLVFSLPVRCRGGFEVEVVDNLNLSEELKNEIKLLSELLTKEIHLVEEGYNQE